MDFDKIGADILSHIGGEENVQSLTHCVTHLRFALADESKVEKHAVERVEDVLGTAFGAGQFQVVMGKNLAPAFDALTSAYHFGGGSAEAAELSTYRLIDLLANVPFYFMPPLVTFGTSNKLGCSPGPGQEASWAA